MNKKTAKMMKTVGATLAVASAVSMMTGAKNDTMSAKKTMKKAADKMVNFVDTVASIM